jgi:hypothetical protein
MPPVGDIDMAVDKSPGGPDTGADCLSTLLLIPPSLLEGALEEPDHGARTETDLATQRARRPVTVIEKRWSRSTSQR